MKQWFGPLAVIWLAALSGSSPPYDLQSAPPDPTLAPASLNPWTAVNSGLAELNVLSLGVTSDGVLFAGTNAGLFRSLDDFTIQWALVLDTVEVSSIAIAPDDVVYAATHGDGILRSPDLRDNWEALNQGLTNLEIGEVAVAANGILYAAGHLGGVFRSLDDGESWVEVHDTGLDNPFVPSLAIDANTIAFAGTDGGVFRSEDSGDTWSLASQGLENPFVESLAIGPDRALFAGTDAGVYRSLDEGDSWEAIHDSTLGTVNVRSVVLNDLNALFAGTHGKGVFRSLTHGQTWEPLNDGLTNLDVSALAIGADGALLAATHGGGVFRRDATTDVSTEGDNPVPSAFDLAGNFPNPFSSSTVIRFAVPSPTPVELVVYDVTGRTVAVLVDGRRAAGWHEVTFDAAGLSSGPYFYRLQAGGHRKVRQMLYVP